ncbi:MAG: hypothetical protein LC797_09195 [Chloroflexi bacterium]|nr:hypothetical protein [Chloroflexota bacterium]
MSAAVTDRPRLSGHEPVALRWLTPPRLYGAGLVFWLATRWLVLVHQGAWPWMNSFVVAAARGIVVGDWNDAVRPQLPDLLGVPLVLIGASEQQAIAVLYLLASGVQFGAFVVLIRTLFPRRLPEQALAMLFFLLVPYDHSIHHYRDVPVVLASAAVFLLSAQFVTFVESRRVQLPWLFGATLLGVWSRFEVLTFVAVLIVLAVLVWRRRALPLTASYAAAAVLVTASLLGVYRLEGVDPSEAWFYTAHTFLDSTPDSWLTPECQADPTENCREADGLSYFGPADLHAGILPLVTGHPLTTAAKTIRSAWDNPVLAESVLPPLSWAPPHPQYHLQLVFPVVVVVVPLLLGLVRMPRGRLLALAFFIGNAGLSAFRYSRYPGY